GRGGGVRAVAEVAPGQLRGDLAVDAQFLDRELLGHRFVDAGEEGVGVGGAGEALAVEVGDLADAFDDRAADQGFDVACHGVAPYGSWRRCRGGLRGRLDMFTVAT